MNRPARRLAPDSLAFALLFAARAVCAVQNGQALPSALSELFAREPLSPGQRGAIQDLSYRGMRQLARSHALIAAMTAREPEPELLAGLLCCAITLLLDAETALHPYPAFTVVDQAVQASASQPGLAGAKNMVNAVLRRFLREHETLLARVLRDPEAAWNYPAWWIAKTKAAYPEQWQQILEVGNCLPPLTLRVNRRKTTISAYLELLLQHGMPAQAIGPAAVRLDRPVPVDQIPGFREGMASVQDAGAQLAAGLLDLKDGMRVLDACAAPGGKTCHLLENADLNLTALDADPLRLSRIHENLDRLGQTARVMAGDARTREWWDGQHFDRILADVPCSASGIVRRHPDIRWLRREQDSAQLATLSARILDNLWMMLKPDGKLLLVTCSIWPEESELQAQAFASRHQAKRLEAPGQLLPTAESGSDHDGLFFALFQKI